MEGHVLTEERIIPFQKSFCGRWGMLRIMRRNWWLCWKLNRILRSGLNQPNGSVGDSGICFKKWCWGAFAGRRYRAGDQAVGRCAAWNNWWIVMCCDWFAWSDADYCSRRLREGWRLSGFFPFRKKYKKKKKKKKKKRADCYGCGFPQRICDCRAWYWIETRLPVLSGGCVMKAEYRCDRFRSSGLAKV